MIGALMKNGNTTASKRIGVAERKLIVPDDLDECNKEIAEMFEGVTTEKNTMNGKGVLWRMTFILQGDTK